jgi:hypothetical protein
MRRFVSALAFSLVLGLLFGCSSDQELESPLDTLGLISPQTDSILAGTKEVALQDSVAFQDVGYTLDGLVQKVEFEYAAKIVCGVQPKLDEVMRLAPGYYATTINIHNPHMEDVIFTSKLVLTYPPSKIMYRGPRRLIPDGAKRIDCNLLQREFFPNGFPSDYIEGFVVIKSPMSLDVTTVFSTATLDGQHSSIEVEPVPERRHAAVYPDLVPVPDPQTGSFCKLGEGYLVVTVKNQGAATAGPSKAEVDFPGFGADTRMTNSLAPGASEDLYFPIPFGCYNPDCDFRITVDIGDDVLEADETNNVATDFCLG